MNQEGFDMKKTYVKPVLARRETLSMVTAVAAGGSGPPLP